MSSFRSEQDVQASARFSATGADRFDMVDVKGGLLANLSQAAIPAVTVGPPAHQPSQCRRSASVEMLPEITLHREGGVPSDESL